MQLQGPAALAQPAAAAPTRNSEWYFFAVGGPQPRDKSLKIDYRYRRDPDKNGARSKSWEDDPGA
jgi:hypothetical protein